jgi:ribosomal-protein-alanine N-acetyltransferase
MDLALFRRFLTEPGLVGLDWAGFRDAQAPARRFAVDGYVGTDDGRLMIEVDADAVAGFVSYKAGSYGGSA